ncbi:MAG: DUF3465 domain-containing protein [Pseudomonadota bacterium]
MANKNLTTRSIPALVLLVLLAQLWQYYGGELSGGNAVGAGQAGESMASSTDGRLQQAFAARENDLQIEGSGTVVKVLPDDTKGSQHQRFLLETNAGQTLLVAHNIDLAPRIPGLREGDRVRFFGEYEWNDRGGVIHWTHHDPGGRHVDGWLEHRGERYE